MKYLAIFLSLLLILTCAGGFWLFLSADVTVAYVTTAAVEAVDRAEDFAARQKDIVNESFLGTVYRADGKATAEESIYYTYTVQLKNSCLIDAEAVEIRLSPEAGDIASWPAAENVRAKAGTTGTVTVNLLTARSNSPRRTMTITYYLWGYPFEIKTSTMNPN